MDVVPLRRPTPTHRCRVCRSLWVLWEGADGREWFSALTPAYEIGPCCDNQPLTDQLEDLR